LNASRKIVKSAKNKKHCQHFIFIVKSTINLKNHCNRIGNITINRSIFSVPRRTQHVTLKYDTVQE